MIYSGLQWIRKKNKNYYFIVNKYIVIEFEIYNKKLRLISTDPQRFGDLLLHWYTHDMLENSK